MQSSQVPCSLKLTYSVPKGIWIMFSFVVVITLTMTKSDQNKLCTYLPVIVIIRIIFKLLLLLTSPPKKRFILFSFTNIIFVKLFLGLGSRGSFQFFSGLENYIGKIFDSISFNRHYLMIWAWNFKEQDLYPPSGATKL
jgi:hypothetical protein